MSLAALLTVGCKRDDVDVQDYDLGIDSNFDTAYGSALEFSEDELKFGDVKAGVVLIDDDESRYLENLDDTNLAWFMNRTGITTMDLDTSKFEFVPMLYGASSTTAFTELISDYLTLSDEEESIKMTAGKISKVAGFYTPELSAGAGISAADAIKYWPALMELGVPLASPVVETANDGDVSQTWLSTFMGYIEEFEYRVDYIYIQHIHDAIDAVRLQEKVEAVHELYPDYPIIVELSLRDWDTTGEYLFTEGEVLSYMKANFNYLDGVDYVYAYAWISYPDEISALFNEDGTKTAVAYYLEERNDDIVSDIAPTYTTNLLDNSYFESEIDWADTKWMRSDDGVSQIAKLDETTPYETISGDYSVKMATDATLLAQNVAVDGGATYRFGMRGRIQKEEGSLSNAEAVDGAESLTIKIYSGDVDITEATPNYGYFFTAQTYVDNATLQTASTTTTITAAANTDLNATITLPTYCESVTIVVEKAEGCVAYVDNLYLIKTTDSTAAIETPKGAENLVTNPDFEDGADDWYLTKAVVTTDDVIRGSNSILITRAGTTNGYVDQLVPVTPGETYVFGFTGRVQASAGEVGSANEATNNAWMTLNLQVSRGSTTNANISTTDRIMTSENVTVYGEYTVPETYTNSTMNIRVILNGRASADAVAYVDDVFFYSKSSVETEFAGGFYYPSDESNYYVNGTFETYQETGVYGATAGYYHSTVENTYSATSGFGGDYIGQLSGGSSYANLIQTFEGNFKAGERYQFGMVGCATTVGGGDPNAMSFRMFVRGVNSSNANVTFDTSAFIYNNDMEYITTSEIVDDYAGVVTLPASYTSLQVVIAGASTTNADDLAHFDYVYFVPYGSSNNMGVGDVEESAYSDLDAQEAYPAGYSDAAAYNIVDGEYISSIDNTTELIIIENVTAGGKYRFGFTSTAAVDLSLRNVVGSYGNYDYDTAIPASYYNIFSEDSAGVAGYMEIPANVDKVAMYVSGESKLTNIYFALVDDWYDTAGNTALHTQVDSDDNGYYDAMGTNLLKDGGFTTSSVWAFSETGAELFEERMLKLTSGGYVSQDVTVIDGCTCDFGFEGRMQGATIGDDVVTIEIYDGETLLSSKTMAADADTFVLIEDVTIPDGVTTVMVKISMSGTTADLYAYVDNAFTVMTSSGLGYPMQLDIDGSIEASYNISDFSNFLTDGSFSANGGNLTLGDSAIVDSEITTTSFGKMLEVAESETAKSETIAFDGYQSYTFGFTGRVADAADAVKMVMYNAANDITLATASTNDTTESGAHATATYANPNDGSVESVYFQIEKSGSAGVAYVDNAYAVQTEEQVSGDIPTDQAGMLAAYPDGLDPDDSRNLVLDGGFELYALKSTAWTIANSATILSSSTLMNDGSTSNILSLTGATTTNVVQEISVTPGASYRFGATARIVDADGNAVTNGNTTTYINLVIKSAADGTYSANAMLSDYDTYETSDLMSEAGYFYGSTATDIKGVITIPDDLSKIRVVVAKPAGSSETSTVAYVDNIYFALVDDYDFSAKDETAPIEPSGYSYSSIVDVDLNEVANYDFSSTTGWSGDGEYFALESYNGKTLYKLSGASGSITSTSAITPEAGTVNFGFIGRLDSGTSVVMNLVDSSGAIMASTTAITTTGVDTAISASYTASGSETLYAQILYTGSNSVGRAYVDDVYMIPPVAKIAPVAPSGYDIYAVLGEESNLVANSDFESLDSWTISGTAYQSLDTTNSNALCLDGSSAVSTAEVSVVKYSKYQFGFAGREGNLTMQLIDQSGNIVATTAAITSSTDTYEYATYTVGETVTSLTTQIVNAGSNAAYVDNAYLMMTFDSTAVTDTEAAAAYPDGIVLGDSYSQYNKIGDPGVEEAAADETTGSLSTASYATSTTGEWYRTSAYVFAVDNFDMKGDGVTSRVFKFTGGTTANVLQNFEVEGGYTYKFGMTGKVTSADGGETTATVLLTIRNASNTIYTATYENSKSTITYSDGVYHLSGSVYIPEGETTARVVVARSGAATDIGYIDNIYCAKVVDYYGGVAPDSEPDEVAVTSISITSTGDATTLVEGERLDFEAAVTPDDATNSEVQWISSDPDIATFDGSTLTAVAVGSTTITAIATDGSNVVSNEIAIAVSAAEVTNSDVAVDVEDNMLLDGVFEDEDGFADKNNWGYTQSATYLKYSEESKDQFMSSGGDGMLLLAQNGSTGYIAQNVTVKRDTKYKYGFTGRVHSADGSASGENAVTSTTSHVLRGRILLASNTGTLLVDAGDLSSNMDTDVSCEFDTSDLSTHFGDNETLEVQLRIQKVYGGAASYCAYVDNAYLIEIESDEPSVDPTAVAAFSASTIESADNSLSDGGFEGDTSLWTLSNSNIITDTSSTKLLKMTGGEASATYTSNFTARYDIPSTVSGNVGTTDGATLESVGLSGKSVVRFGFSARVMNSADESTTNTSVKAYLYKSDDTLVAATDAISTLSDESVERTYLGDAGDSYYIVIKSSTTDSTDIVYVDNVYVTDPMNLLLNGAFEAESNTTDAGWDKFNGSSAIKDSTFATLDDNGDSVLDETGTSIFGDAGGDKMLYFPTANNMFDTFTGIEADIKYIAGCSVYADKNVNSIATTDPYIFVNLNTDSGATAYTYADSGLITSASDCDVLTHISAIYAPTSAGSLKFIIMRTGGTNDSDYVYVDNAYVLKLEDATTGIE